MIPYHGGPFSDRTVAAEVYRGRHGMISFARPGQLELIAECAQSFALDNGAFTAWRAGRRVEDWNVYYRWVEMWRRHPGCDFALIPDVIEGSELENDDLVAEWPFDDCGVPVHSACLGKRWASPRRTEKTRRGGALQRGGYGSHCLWVGGHL